MPLVDDLLVLLGAFPAALELLQEALNVLHGHVVGPGGLNGVSQLDIGLGVRASPGAGRRLDGPQVLGDELAALQVVRGLLALNLSPFAVTGHSSPYPL